MARRIVRPATSTGPTEEHLERWLGRFLLANDGDLAATISAELRSAKGLTAKWRVIDRWGLREQAQSHMDYCLRVREQNAGLGESGMGM